MFNEPTNIDIDAASYDFLLDDETRDETYIGLRVNTRDGGSITIPMPGQDAETVGRLLIAHADYVAGRPPRSW